MEVKQFADPTAFRSLVDPFLLRNEARNALFYGVTGILIDRPEVYEEFYLWSVVEDGEPVAAAAMTPPHNLLLADDATYEALAELAQHMDNSEIDLPGVQGNRPPVDQFCALWNRARGMEADLEVELGVHALTEVSGQPEVRGEPRVATLDDLDLIAQWVTAFLKEADPLSPKSNVERAVKNRLGIDPELGGTWLWEVNGEPAALSGYGGRTPNGIRIGPVYTPPRHRRQGYATALVARQSAWLLEQDREFCFLFTDLANPTSNSIYRKIGYEKVGDARRYGFRSKSPTTL
jgi:predicted GNAT family acetyltransferase